MKITLSITAERQVERLDAVTRNRVLKKLNEYGTYENPLAFAKSIKGAPGHFRFRVGDIRIIFTIYAGALIVVRVGRRDSIY